MAARDDYPSMASWSKLSNVFDLELRRALDEIDRLRGELDWLRLAAVRQEG